MFEFRRELRKLFGGESAKPFADGLTGGDSALLELLDLDLLSQEARNADIAAGRVGARDKAERRLEAAIVWREVARRSGDPVALRKAAATAEIAADAFDAARRPDGWARARVEQAYCALLGADLFGDPGLSAAAEVAFREGRAGMRSGVAAPLADIGLAAIQARHEMTCGDAAAARTAAARFDAPIVALDTLTRRSGAARVHAAEARLLRADILCGWGAQLKDTALLRNALDDATAAVARLDSTYEPLTWARAEIARGQAMTLWGEAFGDVDAVAKGAEALATALDHLTRDHSPFDWARTQMALARALQTLGDVSANERAYEQAVTCYDRANLVLKDAPTSMLRAAAAGARAVCLARSAELTGDIAVLDAAEAAMKIELSTFQARRDPVGWALAQVHLARLYEARMDMTGVDDGARAAMIALDAALEVFAEEGLRSLSVVASDAMERLRGRAMESRATL